MSLGREQQGDPRSEPAHDHFIPRFTVVVTVAAAAAGQKSGGEKRWDRFRMDCIVVNFFYIQNRLYSVAQERAQNHSNSTVSFKPILI